MGKCHKLSNSGTAKGSIGMEGEWLGHIQFPEFGGQGVVALEDNVVVVANGDSGGIKGNITASIT